MTLYAVVRFVGDLVEPWHKKRGRCFGLLVYALMRGQRLGVAQLGATFIPTSLRFSRLLSVSAVARCRLPGPRHAKATLAAAATFSRATSAACSRLWCHQMSMGSSSPTAVLDEPA